MGRREGVSRRPGDMIGSAPCERMWPCGEPRLMNECVRFREELSIPSPFSVHAHSPNGLRADAQAKRRRNSARLENVTTRPSPAKKKHATSGCLPANEVLPWLRSIAMFKSPTDVERAKRDQDADSARIHAAIEAAEKTIAALAARQLDPDEVRKEWSAIRDRTILAIGNVRNNLKQRASSAKQTERWMAEKWLREVNDGRILREFTAELQKVPTRSLLDYLRYLIQFGDLARIQSVNAVFAARADNQRYKTSFDTMLGQFTLSKCGITGAYIAKIYDLAEMVDVRIANLFSAPCMTKRPPSPLSEPLPRIEGPSINPRHVDVSLPSESGGEPRPVSW